MANAILNFHFDYLKPSLTLTMSPSPFTRTVESRHAAKQLDVKVVVMEELKKELKIEVKEVRKRGADILSG